MKIHLMPVRMATIKKSKNIKCWRGCGENGTFFHCWWECKLVQPLWRTVWLLFKKLEIEWPYDPAIPLLGIYTEETKTERDTCTPMFIAALFIMARTWKQPRCPSAEKNHLIFNKLFLTQLYIEFHLTGNPPFQYRTQPPIPADTHW